MKKFLLFVITVILSLLLVNNKIYAQEYPEYPTLLIKIPYLPYVLYPVAEHNNTYEYELVYLIRDIYFYEDVEYYLISEYVFFRKGIDRRTNSYELIEKSPRPDLGWTTFTLHVTVLKSVVNEYRIPEDPLDPTPLFRYYSALYVEYTGDIGSIEYEVGYQDGYGAGYEKGLDDGFDNGYDTGFITGYNYGYGLGKDEGYIEGYERGYNAGINETQPNIYQRGYNDGYSDGYNDGVNEPPMSFVNNLHVWIVPAIIIVIIAGIFVGYRRERHWND